MVELMPRFSSTVRPQEPSDFSSAKFLHIARAHLHAIAVFGHQVDVAVAHDFRDKPSPVASLALRRS